MSNFRLRVKASIFTSLVALSTTVNVTDAEARLVGLNIATREPFVGGATWGHLEKRSISEQDGD